MLDVSKSDVFGLSKENKYKAQIIEKLRIIVSW